MLTLTKNEMLALWRKSHGLDTLRADCSVEAVDGIDIDAWLEPKMRRWYLNLLDTAPAHLVPVGEFGRSSSVTVTASPVGAIVPPAAVRRVLSVKLQGWQRPVVPVSEEEAAGRLGRLASPFFRPGRNEPLAVVRADGTLLVAPVDVPVVESLRCVADPGEDVYQLDETLLT